MLGPKRHGHAYLRRERTVGNGRSCPVYELSSFYITCSRLANYLHPHILLCSSSTSARVAMPRMNRFLRSLPSIDSDSDIDSPARTRSRSISEENWTQTASLESPFIPNTFPLREEERHFASNFAEEYLQKVPNEQVPVDLGAILLWLYAFWTIMIDSLVLFVRL